MSDKVTLALLILYYHYAAAERRRWIKIGRPEADIVLSSWNMIGDLLGQHLKEKPATDERLIAVLAAIKQREKKEDHCSTDSERFL